LRTETPASAWPKLAEVMPHRGDMLLLSRVLAHGEESTCCEVDLEAQTFLRRPDSSLPPWVALEYMAQCVAAREGLRANAAGHSLDSGLLIGARQVHFFRSRLPSEGCIEVSARHLTGRVGLGVLSYACEVRDANPDASLWAKGTLNVALLDITPRSDAEFRATDAQEG
jgi:predicted hotdog family 3-hydroxylacyl-ACP dehydratase